MTYFEPKDLLNIDNINEFVNQAYQQGRAEAIGEIATRLEQELAMYLRRDNVKYVMYKVHTVLEQLKEQNNAD